MGTHLFFHARRRRTYFGHIEHRNGGPLIPCRAYGAVLYQVPGVNSMNPNRIIWAAVLFQIALIFCLWVSFSARVIRPGEILARAGIVAMWVAAIYAVIRLRHRRHLH
jgi:hypothetical protein